MSIFTVKKTCKMIPKLWQVEFTIIKDGTTSPVVGAKVTCDGKTGTTNAAGVVTLSPFSRGDFSFTVDHADYDQLVDSVTIA